MTPIYSQQRGPSCRGIFAGSLMGLLVVMIMAALALVLSAFLPFNLKGTSIAAGLYATFTSGISALVGGYFAVKCARMRLVVNELGKFEPENTTMLTVLTATAIVVMTTLLTLSSATSVLATASQAMSHTLPSIESTVLTTLTQPPLSGVAGDNQLSAVPEQVLIEAEETARQAALFSGLFWLINTIVTFISCSLGSRLALLSYRLDSPINHLSEDDL